MTRALVTGFEPFDGASVNPSQRLVEMLAAEPPDAIELVTAVLPVSWARASGELERAVGVADAELVVCFGQAAGRSCISIERFALEHHEARVDNDGAEPGEEIDPNEPVAYRSTLPVDAIVAALRADGIPAAASRDAGGFLCNRVFYALMRMLAERPGARGGFVHVPLLPEQALETAAPTMPLETLVRAARLVLATAA